MKTTMRQFFALAFILSTVFISCSNKEKKDNKEKYSNDLKSFSKSLEIFDSANKFALDIAEKSKSGEQIDTSVIRDNFRQMFDKIKEGIAESEKVSDEFLDFLHPKLKSMYRDTFVGSFKMMIEFREKGDYSKANALDQKVNSMQQSFFAFLEANQNDFQKLSNGDNATKKSYWRMLVRFFISDFAALIVFSFLIVILLLPIMPIALLGEKLSTNVSAALSFPFIIIAAAGQLYFWMLWASYCTSTIKHYMDSPTVTHNWLYYLTGFFAVSAPIGWLGNKESQGQNYEDRKNTQKGTLYYSLIAIVCFIVFCIWTNLLDYKFVSWVNEWLY
jgi:hypothetical protein